MYHAVAQYIAATGNQELSILLKAKHIQDMDTANMTQFANHALLYTNDLLIIIVEKYGYGFNDCSDGVLSMLTRKTASRLIRKRALCPLVLAFATLRTHNLELFLYCVESQKNFSHTCSCSDFAENGSKNESTWVDLLNLADAMEETEFISILSNKGVDAQTTFEKTFR
jgi:hypothetical protein